MRKLFVGLALVSTTLAFAQTEKESKSFPFTYGAKAGVSMSSIAESNKFTKQDNKIGFYAGVYAQMPISESFTLNGEVLYSQYGSKSEFKEEGVNFSSTTNLDYVTVPVTVQYSLFNDFYVEAGPEFGFMLSAKVKTKNEDNGVSETTPDFKNNLNKFNLGIGVGAGYFITENIGVTARYVAGVTDLAKNYLKGDKASRNNVLQVGVTYKF